MDASTNFLVCCIFYQYSTQTHTWWVNSFTQIFWKKAEWEIDFLADNGMHFDLMVIIEIEIIANQNWSVSLLDCLFFTYQEKQHSNIKSSFSVRSLEYLHEKTNPKQT